MFSRIFNIQCKKESAKENGEKQGSCNLDSFQAVPRLPKLGQQSIRVLIFKDCERRADKTLLFDSDAIVTIDEISEQNVKDTKSDTKPDKSRRNKMTNRPTLVSSSPQKYQCRKPSGDVKMLGEMIFGSVAMVYKGSVLKVHLMRTPPQLMMTKVFALRSRSSGVNFCDGELSLSSAGSINAPQINVSQDSISLDSRNASPVDNMIRSYSNPIGMQRHSLNKSSMSLNTSASTLNRSTWSVSSTDELTRSSSVLSLGSSMASPCGSYQRRFIRSQRTSLESTQMWRTKSEQSEEMRTAFKQQPKIGIGIIFKLWDNAEENKLFEAHLQTLRVKIEKSFYLRQKFMDTAISAVECFKEDIFRLCYSPRILEPVWLNLMVTAEHAYHETLDNFIRSFMNLVHICENKENNYFLSILLTAVLTHHTSWVATVMSSGSDAKRAYLDKHSSKALDVLAKFHPYNPLWAQLCDLYGSTGSPLRIARTIIVGKNASLVTEILHLLTYFIRCSDIKENRLRIAKNRDSLYRNSACSWSESYYSGTPNSVRCWIDNNESLNNTPKVCSIEPQVKFEKTNVNTFNDFDISKCYCHVLKQLDMIGKTKLYEIISNSEMFSKSFDEENSFSTKACACCRTLEKPLQNNYCEKCRYLKEHLAIEIDNYCHHCARESKNDRFPVINEKKNDQVPLLALQKEPFGNASIGSETSYGSQKKATFKCYCCDEKHLSDETILEDTLSINDITPRARNTSDPVDCVIPKLKTGLLRNSTTSHDSGTEMACSITSSTQEIDSTDSISITRNNSMSSHEDRENENDMATDSDYCSVDNENLTSSEHSIPIQDLPSTLKNGNVDLHFKELLINDDNIGTQLGNVSKSCSSTTLKDISTPLSSSFERNDGLFIVEQDECGCNLEGDLKNMNLQEVPLLGTTHKLSRRQSKCPGTSTFEPMTFGQSLFAGYTDSYLPNFVLQGTSNLNCERLATDLKNTVKEKCTSQDVDVRNQYSIVDEQVSDAVCIVADTDNWTCELWTLAKRTDSFNGSTSESLNTKPIFASGLVSSMIESTKELWDIKMAPHFCLLHLEEQLKDIYNRSKVLDEYCMCNDEVSKSSFMKGFGYHANDIELLTSISTSHMNIVDDDSVLY